MLSRQVCDGHQPLSLVSGSPRRMTPKLATHPLPAWSLGLSCRQLPRGVE
jgi:hypothetical protein